MMMIIKSTAICLIQPNIRGIGVIGHVCGGALRELPLYQAMGRQPIPLDFDRPSRGVPTVRIERRGPCQ